MNINVLIICGTIEYKLPSSPISVRVGKVSVNSCSVIWINLPSLSTPVVCLTKMLFFRLIQGEEKSCQCISKWSSSHNIYSFGLFKLRFSERTFLFPMWHWIKYIIEVVSPIRMTDSIIQFKVLFGHISSEYILQFVLRPSNCWWSHGSTIQRQLLCCGSVTEGVTEHTWNSFLDFFLFITYSHLNCLNWKCDLIVYYCKNNLIHNFCWHVTRIYF